MKKSYPAMREDVSSIWDGFSAWVKADIETILRRHVVDAKGFFPALREAPARRHEPSSQEYRFYDDVPNSLTEQRRLSVYNWNDAEKEPSKGILRENGTSSPRYCSTRILSFWDIKVSSIYLHDTMDCEQDKTKEG